MPVRIAFFDTHFQGVQVVAGVRKKPYPDGLKRIMEMTTQPADAIMKVTYVTYPYANFNQRPLQESFFWSLRFFERRLLQSYCWLRGWREDKRPSKRHSRSMR